MKNNIPCKACGKERMIDTSKFSVSRYLARSPNCRICATKKPELRAKISKGWFTHERLLGNKNMLGVPAWNKGMRGIHLSPASEFKKGENLGIENPKWKGDAVGYFALHTWVNRHKKKTGCCIHCNKKRKTEWANRSWEYQRDLNDWLELCRNCHVQYDSQVWGHATRIWNL